MTDEHAKPADRIKSIWTTSDTPLKDLWAWAREPSDLKRRAERFDALADWAGEHKRDTDHDADAWKDWRKRQRIYRRQADRILKRAEADDVAGIENGWHPDARRAGVVSPVGPLSGPPRLVWHTTEGYGLPSYVGSNPHFTLDPKTGVLYQHQPVTGAARALANASGGVETNTRGAIQVELIGFAAQTQTWSDDTYAEVAELARWIEKHCGVPRSCDVTFGGPPGQRMSADKWNAYSGHCGHQHVPENDHWDPGAFRIDKVLDR